MPSDERFTCTKADPWTPEKGDFATHPDAVADEPDTCSEGCCDKYRCPTCGLRFTVEGADA